VLSAACLVILFAAVPASPQDTEPQPPEPVLPGSGSMDDFVEGNTRLPQILRQIPTYIKDREWHTVAHSLQMLLDASGSALLQECGKDAEGKPFVRWHSPNVAANALLARLPVEAIKVYNEHYGSLGRDLLARAKQQNDPRLLAQAIRRGLYTSAGPEALTLLGGQHHEAGRYLPAALCYERLLRQPFAEPTTLTLYRAAVAFRVTGDRAGSDRVWKQLATKIDKTGLVLGERKFSVEQARQELERVAAASEGRGLAWLLFQGNAARSGQGAAAGTPVLDKVIWQRRTLLDVFEGSGEVDKGKEAEPWIDRARRQRDGQQDAPVLPGFFPLAVGDKVIYRTHAGITCVQLTELKDKQGQVEAKPGDIEWKPTELEGSLAMLLADNKLRGPVQNWLQTYEKQGFGGVVFENPAAGTLSSDGQFVYVVDDLSIPPTGPRAGITGTLSELIAQNSLQAYQLKTGKLEWRQGDPSLGGHWLGAPLPLGGTLYALNERDGQLRLVSLDPAKGGKVLSQHLLATVQDTVAASPLRCTQPVHLAYSDGVLICPTNAGAILAVDLLTESLLWVYTYREGRSGPQGGVNLRPEWHNTAPVIAGGKVVFTAAGEGSVHCLDLRDGSLQWKAKRDDDLYLAGVRSGKVLLVGKRDCRALALKDGKQVWRVETGVPSGMGVAAGNTYYLPLRNAVGGKGPAIGAVDLEKGQPAQVHTGLKEAPGNLLVHGGQLIAQGPTTITAYPARKH